MDRSSETTDAFAEVEFKNSKFKTEVCRKSLNPTWPNTDWFRFDVDDCDLQDEPLQIRIMDYDIYSAKTFSLIKPTGLKLLCKKD